MSVNKQLGFHKTSCFHFVIESFACLFLFLFGVTLFILLWNHTHRTLLKDSKQDSLFSVATSLARDPITNLTVVDVFDGKRHLAVKPNKLSFNYLFLIK